MLEIAHTSNIRGRPRSYPFREIVNGILYITKTGYQWQMLPPDFAYKVQFMGTLGPGIFLEHEVKH